MGSNNAYTKQSKKLFLKWNVDLIGDIYVHVLSLYISLDSILFWEVDVGLAAGL